MVNSRLDPDIQYVENKKLEPEDKNMDAELYESDIMGQSVIIALGHVKHTHIEKNIVVFPVYLIKDEKVSMQIGLYEILAERQTEIYDEDDDIDVSKLGDILLYSFVTKEIIKDASTQVNVEGDEVEEGEEKREDYYDSEEVEESYKEGNKTQQYIEEEEKKHTETLDKLEELEEQSEAQAEKERKAYKKEKDEPWIQTYMNNNNFNFVDNEGGGDCLFAAIRDGLATVGRNVSVEEMRKILSDEANQELFESYRNMYDMILREVNQNVSVLKDLVSKHKELKAKAKKTASIEEQKQILEQANIVAKEHLKAKKTYSMAQSLLTEYNYMKDANTLEQFKALILTCNFWGETWSISTLERVLNVKLILFSLQAYKSKDYDNVLLCGQLNDEILQSIGTFEPDHYIMLEYMGAHYKLITYKDRGSFKFKEVPYNVRKLIVDRCLEGQSGPFNIIPEFKAYLKQKQVSIPEEEEPMMETDLYNDNTVFQFYSKSAHSKPGKGSGEKIGPEGELAYSELASIQDWRKMLSNFWIAPFKLDGHTWNSVEHYYQASKFKENNPDFYLRFAIDVHPEDPVAQEPVVAKSAGGKTGKFKGKQIRPKGVVIDPNFFGGRHTEEMERAMRAKFSQNPELKKVLLLTKKAKLVHFQRGSPPVVFDHLMRVRQELSK
jgi:predicted NAD-dependent protein-ADP-ribosyltransferase YbiA (DUF1768 family)